MREGSIHDTEKKRPVILVLLVLILYGIINALFVLVPFIPGLITFFSWGLVLPLVFIIGTWIYLARSRNPGKSWWIAGIGCSLVYAALGAMTFYVIAVMWASV